MEPCDNLQLVVSVATSAPWVTDLEIRAVLVGECWPGAGNGWRSNSICAVARRLAGSPPRRDPQPRRAHQSGADARRRVRGRYRATRRDLASPAPLLPRPTRVASDGPSGIVRQRRTNANEVLSAACSRAPLTQPLAYHRPAAEAPDPTAVSGADHCTPAAPGLTLRR